MSLPTTPATSPESTQEVSNWLRRAGVVLLLAFVLIASLWSVREASLVKTSGEVTGHLTWSSIGRRGLAAPLVLAVTFPAGTGEVIVDINTDYLTKLDHNAWIPEPAAMEEGGGFTRLIYEVSGDRFEGRLDSRFSPSLSPGAHPLEVIVRAAGETLVFRDSTWLVP